MKLLRDIPLVSIPSYVWFILTGLRAFQRRHGMNLYVKAER